MATLTNTKIKDTYPALLKASDNGVIGATEKVITDGLGNDSVLKLGTASASFTGDVDVTNSVLSVSDTANGTTLSLDASAGNSIYSDAPLNIYTVSDDMLFSTGGANSTRMTIDALGDISIEENLSIGGSLTSTEDATINGLTVGKGAGNVTQNTAVGSGALANNTTGSSNVAIGYFSLPDNTTGVRNIAVGNGALADNTTGQDNVAVGHNSGALNTGGNSNTSLGSNSLYSNTASGNTAVGSYSLNANTSATQNTAVGADALRENTASSNTAVGHSSLGLNTTGAYNTGVGVSALYANQTGGNNTALGYLSLRNNTADYNTAVGSGSLYDNTSGTFNVALGYNSLYNNTTGNNNTAVGVDSLRNNTTGVNNTALGLHALRSNTEGNHNTSIGAYSLDVNTLGLRNTSVGYSALSSNTEGDDNTSVGYNSLVANTTGLNNVAIGKDALKDNTTGGSNTSIGTSAIAFLNGTDNVAIGQSAGANTTGALPKTAGSQNTYVGAGIRSGAADTTNEIVIGYNTFGNGSNTATYGNASITGHHFTAGQVNVSGNLAVDTNTLYVDAAGNRVGIGTNTPSFNAHIEGSALIKDKLYLQRASSGLNLPIASYWDGTVNPLTGTKGDIVAIGNAGGDGLVFVNSDQERMRIDSSGNVGIGESNPSSKLTIKSGT